MNRSFRFTSTYRSSIYRMDLTKQADFNINNVKPLNSCRLMITKFESSEYLSAILSQSFLSQKFLISHEIDCWFQVSMKLFSFLLFKLQLLSEMTIHWHRRSSYFILIDFEFSTPTICWFQRCQGNSNWKKRKLTKVKNKNKQNKICRI